MAVNDLFEAVLASDAVRDAESAEEAYNRIFPAWGRLHALTLLKAGPHLGSRGAQLLDAFQKRCHLAMTDVFQLSTGRVPEPAQAKLLSALADARTDLPALRAGLLALVDGNVSGSTSAAQPETGGPQVDRRQQAKRIAAAAEVADKIVRFSFCAPDAEPPLITITVHAVKDLVQRLLFAAGRISDEEVASAVASLSGHDDPTDGLDDNDITGAYDALRKVHGLATIVLDLRDDLDETALDQGRQEERIMTNRVFIVHGHDRDAVRALKDYLRTLRLHPFEWEEARGHTENQGTATTLEIVEAGIHHADAVILLFTPDERTEIRSDLVPGGGDAELRYQPRPNVLFEAGWAMARDRRKTIIVEARGITKVSDLDGINAVRIRESQESFDQLTKRLRGAGCQPSDEDPERLNIERFQALFTPVAPAHAAPAAREPAGRRRR